MLAKDKEEREEGNYIMHQSSNNIVAQGTDQGRLIVAELLL